MKPIEIHIEGYKIVISEDKDDKPSITVPEQEYHGIKMPPTEPYTIPCTPGPDRGDWWNKPYVTWTNDDSMNIPQTTNIPPKTTEGIVSEIMKGKTSD